MGAFLGRQAFGHAATAICSAWPIVDGTACEASRYNPRVALLAQLAEQLTLNQRVVGSNPTQGIRAAFGVRAAGSRYC